MYSYPHLPEIRFSLLGTAFLVTVLASGLSTFTEAVEGEDELFSQAEILISAGNQLTIVPGHFLGNVAEDIAFIEKQRDRGISLQLFAFEDSSWSLRTSTSLPDDTLFIDAANIAGEDRLITYSNGGIGWFNPISATLIPLVNLSIEFGSTRSDIMPRVEIARDVNDDGLDDFVVPDLSGFWISLQRAEGVFSEPVKMGPPEPFLNVTAFDDTQSYGDSGMSELVAPWYLSRVHQFDYDRDGRSDLVFWNQDHFDVYLQTPDRAFSSEITSFTTDVPFDSDGVYSLLFSFSEDGTFGIITGLRPNTLRTALQSIRDIDSDGVADMVTVSTEGRSGLRQRGSFDVYYGRVQDNRVVFEQQARSSIEPSGKRAMGYTFMNSADFDGDGFTDILVQKVRTNVVRMLGAMLANAIRVDLEFYRNDDGQFPAEPTIRRSVKSENRWFDSRGPFFPAVFLADINGDSYSDLLVSQDWNEMHVYPGEDSDRLFAEEPIVVNASMPSNEVNTSFTDLNNDGAEDVLIYHPSREQSQRLITLISK